MGKPTLPALHLLLQIQLRVSNDALCNWQCFIKQFHNLYFMIFRQAKKQCCSVNWKKNIVTEMLTKKYETEVSRNTWECQTWVTWLSLVKVRDFASIKTESLTCSQVFEIREAVFPTLQRIIIKPPILLIFQRKHAPFMQSVSRGWRFASINNSSASQHLAGKLLSVSNFYICDILRATIERNSVSQTTVACTHPLLVLLPAAEAPTATWYSSCCISIIICIVSSLP